MQARSKRLDLLQGRCFCQRSALHALRGMVLDQDDRHQDSRHSERPQSGPTQAACAQAQRTRSQKGSVQAFRFRSC